MKAWYSPRDQGDPSPPSMRTSAADNFKAAKIFHYKNGEDESASDWQNHLTIRGEDPKSDANFDPTTESKEDIPQE